MTRTEPPTTVGGNLGTAKIHVPGASVNHIFGMENFGNTCYCNSILQCLFYSDGFRTLLVNHGYDNDDVRRYKREVKGAGSHTFTVKYEQLVQKKLKEQGGSEEDDSVANAQKRKGLIFLKFVSTSGPIAMPNVQTAPPFTHPRIVTADHCEALSTPQRIEVKKLIDFARLEVLVTRCNNTLIKQNITTLKSLSMLLDETPLPLATSGTGASEVALSIIVVGIPYPEPFLNSPVNTFSENPSSDHRKKLALINGPIINLDSPLCPKAQPENLCLVYSLRDMYEAMLEHKLTIGVVSPLYFVAKLKAKNFLFSQNNMHHDAHEFFNYLINEIIECVHRETGGTSNWVNDIFQGEITNETKCLCCETVTLRHEQFIDLLVDIPPLDHRQCHLLSFILNNFSKLEVLTNQNKFYCNRCALLQEAVKTIKIAKLPKVLVINLKRFKYDELVDKMVKLFDLISYPLNMRLLNTTDDKNKAQMYELYALVVHIGGGPTHGHYISICKYRDGLWLLFDDETVEVVDSQYVQRFFGNSPGLGLAYILFYQCVSEDENLFDSTKVFNGLEFANLDKPATPPKMDTPPTEDVVLEESVTTAPATSTPPPPPPPGTQDKKIFKSLSFFDKADNYDPDKTYSSLGAGTNSYIDTLTESIEEPSPVAPAASVNRKKLIFRRREKLVGAGPSDEGAPERKKSIFGFKRKG